MTPEQETQGPQLTHRSANCANGGGVKKNKIVLSMVTGNVTYNIYQIKYLEVSKYTS